jgi:hypothetical protein
MADVRTAGRTMTDLNQRDLQWLVEVLDHWIDIDTMPPERITQSSDVRDRLTAMIAERAGQLVPGKLVFQMTLPLAHRGVGAKGKVVSHPVAPTLNVYASMRPWAQAKLRKEIDVRVMAEFARWPDCRLNGARRARAVKVVRHSTNEPDEPESADAIGGKIPLDALVRAGVLAGDTRALLQREAAWVKAARGDGFLTVEVFELEACAT